MIGRRTDFFNQPRVYLGAPVIDILRDERGHRRLFEGYLREFEAEGTA